MWLNRMLKDRQEILVLGELVLFLAAWGLGMAAAVDDYRERTYGKSGNNVAVKGTILDDPRPLDQRAPERLRLLE